MGVWGLCLAVLDLGFPIAVFAFCVHLEGVRFVSLASLVYRSPIAVFAFCVYLEGVKLVC